MRSENRQDDDRFGQSLPSVLASQRAEGRRNDSEVIQTQRLARTLGWFSIALGVTELVAPRTVARLAGLNGSRGMLRLSGLRQIAHGLGILNSPKPIGWLWSRVFGDVIDLAVLKNAATSPDASRGRIAVAAAGVACVTALDVEAGQALTRVADQIEDDYEAIHITKTVAINRSPEAIYGFWRNYSNLPRVMGQLESVEQTGGNRSRWIAKGPAGKRVEWEAETTEDRPNECIAWGSVPGSGIENSVSVKFESATGKRGTLLRVELSYRPPVGAFGASVAKLLGKDPQNQLADDLHRLKQMLEAGEIISTEGQPAGRANSASWKDDKVARRLATAV